MEMLDATIPTMHSAIENMVSVLRILRNTREETKAYLIAHAGPGSWGYVEAHFNLIWPAEELS